MRTVHPLLLGLVFIFLSQKIEADKNRIILMPSQGKMMCNAVVPNLSRQVFGLGVPETIGCREHLWLVNHSDANIQWHKDPKTGVVSTQYTNSDTISYHLNIIPNTDYIDLELTIKNHTNTTWHDVFAFNCISPARAPDFKDPELTHTFISIDGKPKALAETTRIQGRRPGIGVYSRHPHNPTPFSQAFRATSPDTSDDNWMIIRSKAGNAYMATSSPDAQFLFNNTKFGCIHSAPSFDNIAPGNQVTVRSRVYLAKGNINDFIKRYHVDHETNKTK